MTTHDMSDLTADELTAQNINDTWTVLDSSGSRFWPDDKAESADEAIEAAEAGRGTWRQ